MIYSIFVLFLFISYFVIVYFNIYTIVYIYYSSGNFIDKISQYTLTYVSLK